MNFKLRLFFIWFAASLVAGAVVRPLGLDSADGSEAESLAGLSGNLGQGITLAALGGYRSVSANFVWISMYGDWQYRRKSSVLEKMKLAVSLNPSSVYFWVDGSRIIANDMPVWEVGDEQMERLFDEEDREGVAVREEYARQALRFLEDVPPALEERYKIALERGAIYWQRLKNLKEAIEWFGKALEKPDAPYFVSRVYAELLYRDGRVKAAYEYLKSHYATLPDGERVAMKPFVWQRIEELERELGLVR